MIIVDESIGEYKTESLGKKRIGEIFFKNVTLVLIVTCKGI